MFERLEGGEGAINLANFDTIRSTFIAGSKVTNLTFSPRSPGEPGRLWHPNPLHVLRPPPWHPCAHNLHHDQGEKENQLNFRGSINQS